MKILTRMIRMVIRRRTRVTVRIWRKMFSDQWGWGWRGWWGWYQGEGRGWGWGVGWCSPTNSQKQRVTRSMSDVKLLHVLEHLAVEKEKEVPCWDKVWIISFHLQGQWGNFPGMLDVVPHWKSANNHVSVTDSFNLFIIHRGGGGGGWYIVLLVNKVSLVIIMKFDLVVTG